MSKAAINSWGPAGWTFLHTVSFTYSDTPTIVERQTIKTFIYAFAKCIPCRKCREDFQLMLDDYIQDNVQSVYFSSREMLSKLFVELHNNVNIKLGKPTMSYERVYLLYNSKRMALGPLYLIIFLLVCGIAYVGDVLYRKIKQRRYVKY